MKQPFSIIMEDYNNSGKDYVGVDNCPATKALERIGKKGYTISPDGEINKIYNGGSPAIGKIDRRWELKDFNNLIEGIEFHTFIEFFDEVKQ